MGATKTDIYSEEMNQLATFAKVLGHPARLAILQFLFKTNACVCGDLVTEIGLAQPTISQHLKELKQLGLIQGTIEGTSICYCIHPENWQKLSSQLHQFLNFKPIDNTCC
jgi:predicted transcriptional regulator